MPDAIVVGTLFRAPTTAQRREHGGVVLRQGHRFVSLDGAEFHLVIDSSVTSPTGQAGTLPRGTANRPETLSAGPV
jgi:hypothetical protein